MAPARTRPSASTGGQSRVVTALPEYQPPSHPLNLTGQQAIQDLPRFHKLDSLKNHLKAANDHLADAAAEINDRYQERNAQNEKRKARKAAAMSSQESDEEAENEMTELHDATDRMTQQLDRGVRKIIDGGEEVKVIEEVLRELSTNAANGRDGSTQSTLGASQFKQRRRRAQNDLEEDEDEDMEDRTNENVGAGMVDVLKEKVDQHRLEYSASTMTARYASHNDYVGFKKMVHDAYYPGEEAPPMPHASTWFGESGGTQFSSSNGPQGTQLDENDDDDLVMASERISVKCPITLTEMKDPVSSTKCPHNYERQAFLEMINNSELRTDGDGSRGSRKKAMRCPVAGCDALLTADDVHTNAVLVRKIKRIQAALRAQNEPYYDDDELPQVQRKKRALGHHSEEVTSSSPQPSNQQSRQTPARLKSERMSQASRQVSMVPNTQIVDMEDEDT